MKIGRYNRGLTLVELLISAAILGFCVSPLLSASIGSVSMNDAASNRLRAASHLDFVMESIKNVAFAAIPVNMGGAAWNAWTFDTAGVTATGLVALKNETITTNLTGTNPIDVTVTVTWSDANSRSRSLIIRTLITG
ncbi:MAG: prepilin-type N-terminal cleavage/methylation domain-containing protein [Candidatus Omnitrophica bacterium]|nr:prepilin-type N-terminal cleavage/methylation domain-containing protein [Candidatus Omnitrophota bacterium]